jgi:hypothetical protein
MNTPNKMMRRQLIQHSLSLRIIRQMEGKTGCSQMVFFIFNPLCSACAATQQQ